MSITVRPAVAADIAELEQRDFRFTIDAILTGPFDGPDLTLTARPVPPRDKTYPFDKTALREGVGGGDSSLFVAQAREHMPVGYLLLSRAWNGYASIDDYAVDRAHRRLGAGRLLLDAAIAWTRMQGLPGVRLETQSTNVAACRHYADYGFTLEGHDRALYRALHPDSDETALYWYLWLDGADQRVIRRAAHSRASTA